MHKKKGLAAKNANAQDSPPTDFDCIITDPTTIESVMHRTFFESKPLFLHLTAESMLIKSKSKETYFLKFTAHLLKY